MLEGNKGLKKEVKKVQRKLGIAVEDRAPQPEDESKRERFVLLKYNDPEYMGYYTIRAQDSYTTKKLKIKQVHFPNLVVLLDFKCSPNSKTLYNRIKKWIVDLKYGRDSGLMDIFTFIKGYNLTFDITSDWFLDLRYPLSKSQPIQMDGLKKVESRPIIVTTNLLNWMGFKGKVTLLNNLIFQRFFEAMKFHTMK